MRQFLTVTLHARSHQTTHIVVSVTMPLIVITCIRQSNYSIQFALEKTKLGLVRKEPSTHVIVLYAISMKVGIGYRVEIADLNNFFSQAFGFLQLAKFFLGQNTALHG